MTSTRQVLYQDSGVSVDSEGITIHTYFFPLGIDKRIDYSEMQSAHTDEELDLPFYAYKAWGMGLSLIWWAAGCRGILAGYERGRNIVVDTGSPIRKGFTTEQPLVVLALIRRHIGSHRVSRDVKRKVLPTSVPPPSPYRSVPNFDVKPVCPGDTLHSIAARSLCTVEELKVLNNIPDGFTGAINLPVIRVPVRQSHCEQERPLYPPPYVGQHLPFALNSGVPCARTVTPAYSYGL